MSRSEFSTNSGNPMGIYLFLHFLLLNLECPNIFLDLRLKGSLMVWRQLLFCHSMAIAYYAPRKSNSQFLDSLINFDR